MQEADILAETYWDTVTVYRPFKDTLPYFAALEQENSNKNMLTSMAAQADIYEKLIETEKNQLVIMQAIADLYEKENGGV